MTIKKVLLCLTLAFNCGAHAGSSAYKVVSGDTLFGIAKNFNTSVPELVAHNGLSSHRIVPGQTLRIPSQNSSESGTQQLSYTVRSGDSLSAIASRHRVSVAALRDHNRIKGNLLHPGQVLFIPEGDNPYTTPVNKPTVAVHSVKRGDTLWDISKQYRVSVASISRYNGLGKNAALIPGQKIRIPSGGLPQTATASSGNYLAKGSDPRLESHSVMVIDALSGTPLYQKNAHAVKPIASITKLMTAMVTLDAKLAMNETLTIDNNDLDRLKGTGSRLPMGTKLTRYDMLHLALMSSENRAASALSRHYPGGKTAFLAAMNSKAKALGMSNSYFADATGLNPKNVSTAQDLAKLVAAASKYDLIRKLSTDQGQVMRIANAGSLQYLNTNPLVRQGDSNISLSKTGYINEAGRCLVMETKIGSRPAYMVFLQSNGKYSPIGDAKRVKQWIESGAAGINLAAL